MDSTQAILGWAKAVDGLNRSDLEPFGQILADDCVWTDNDHVIGSNRDEVLAGLKARKDAGWVSHHIVTLAVEGDFMVSTGRNDVSDGSSGSAAGSARFGADGKIVEVRSISPQILMSS